MGCKVVFNRTFAMPSHNTFSVKPIGEFVRRYMKESKVSVDPFSRDYEMATHTNDLNPETKARYHMQAAEFCEMLVPQQVHADLGIFDPPYSPRQISECYKGIGLPVGTKDTQNARLYKEVRDALDKLIAWHGHVLSFGWNSGGMGKTRGYEIVEILLVAHGGAHNDTICMAERKMRG